MSSAKRVHIETHAVPDSRLYSPSLSANCSERRSFEAQAATPFSDMVRSNAMHVRSILGRQANARTLGPAATAPVLSPADTAFPSALPSASAVPRAPLKYYPNELQPFSESMDARQSVKRNASYEDATNDDDGDATDIEDEEPAAPAPSVTLPHTTRSLHASKSLPPSAFTDTFF